jgi:hypothetical protein
MWSHKGRSLRVNSATPTSSENSGLACRTLAFVNETERLGHRRQALLGPSLQTRSNGKLVSRASQACVLQLGPWTSRRISNTGRDARTTNGKSKSMLGHRSGQRRAGRGGAALDLTRVWHVPLDRSPQLPN